MQYVHFKGFQSIHEALDKGNWVESPANVNHEPAMHEFWCIVDTKGTAFLGNEHLAECVQGVSHTKRCLSNNVDVRARATAIRLSGLHRIPV
jgi:hypothetical protein